MEKEYIVLRMVVMPKSNTVDIILGQSHFNPKDRVTISVSPKDIEWDKAIQSVIYDDEQKNIIKINFKDGLIHRDPCAIIVTTEDRAWDRSTEKIRRYSLLTTMNTPYTLTFQVPYSRDYFKMKVNDAGNMTIITKLNEMYYPILAPDIIEGNVLTYTDSDLDYIYSKMGF